MGKARKCQTCFNWYNSTLYRFCPFCQQMMTDEKHGKRKNKTGTLNQQGMPSTQPTMPLTQPTMPLSQPAMPPTQPTMPLDGQPTMPLTQPTMPLGGQPTMPLTQPTMPLTQPAMESDHDATIHIKVHSGTETSALEVPAVFHEQKSTEETYVDNTILDEVEMPDKIKIEETEIYE